MARTGNLNDFLTDVANAIRTKTEEENTIPAEQFDTKIASINTLKGETITITPSTSQQVITPSSGKNAITQATVNGVTSAIDNNIQAGNIKKDVTILGVTGTLEEGSTINNQNKTVTPTTSQQSVTADSGYTGLGTVTINAVDSTIDSNIAQNNIKSGVTILGVTGNLAPDKPDQTKTCTPTTSQQIIEPDTGYELASVTVNAVTSSIDSNIAAGNIKKDINILGVTGTLEEGEMSETDYNTALDVANDILGIEIKTYGIKRLLSSTSPVWERTNDSIEMVANATKDGTGVVNDFDTAPIYKDIITQNYNTTTKQVVAKYGDQNFTFTPSDDDVKVMTYIPEFWIKRWQDDEYEYIQITNQETTGFIHIPSRRVGRYTTGGTSSVPIIKSGQTPLVNISLSNLRTAAKSLNTDVCLMDIWTWNILQILYLVEYASYNSQDKLGLGYVDGNSSALASGGCDSLGMKSGCVTNDGKHAVIYRGIENFFGNVFQWLDGINFIGRQGYVCSDYTQYNSNTSTNYTKLNYGCPRSNGGYIGSLGYDNDNPLVMVPSDMGGSDTSGVTDFYRGSNSGNFVVFVGGFWTFTSENGAFCLYANGSPDAASVSDSTSGRFIQYDSTAI